MKESEQLAKVRLLLTSDKAVEAKEAFDSIPAYDTVNYFIVKGAIEQKFQRWGNAINAYNKVLEIDPDNEEAKNNLHLIQNILNFWNPDQFNP